MEKQLLSGLCAYVSVLPLKCLENISLASRQASDNEEVNGATSPTRVAEPVGGEVA